MDQPTDVWGTRLMHSHSLTHIHPLTYTHHSLSLIQVGTGRPVVPPVQRVNSDKIVCGVAIVQTIPRASRATRSPVSASVHRGGLDPNVPSPAHRAIGVRIAVAVVLVSEVLAATPKPADVAVAWVGTAKRASCHARKDFGGKAVASLANVVIRAIRAAPVAIGSLESANVPRDSRGNIVEMVSVEASLFRHPTCIQPIATHRYGVLERSN